jgi:elongation factor G
MLPINQIRNFGVIAHIDSGKTTVSERILYLTGRIHQMGEVHDGTATLDFDPLEQEKGITIQAAVTSVTWREHHLNLIDTPGHVDFTAEVERSCRVLDGAVAVFCAVAGVQAQSETVWRQAERYGVPRLIFINKVDRPGADVDAVIQQLRKRLGAVPVVLTYPFGTGEALGGVIDVLSGKLHRFGGADHAAWTQEALPASETARCATYRRALVEAVAAESDDLLAHWDAHGDLDAVDVVRGLRTAVRRGALHPVLCGAALSTIGIQPLLEAIVELLPHPGEAKPVIAHRLDQDAPGALTLSADPKLPLRALVFKVVCTAHGEIGFCRVYQGTLREGDHLWCPNRGTAERAARLVKLHGAHHATVKAVGPGDLCAIIGIHQAVTGDTICPFEDQVALEGITFAQPVIGMSVETESASDKEALVMALAKLAREDPTFTRQVDPESGQLVISGMGELHLEVIAHRLEHQHRVRVKLGQPTVSLRQRITHTLESRGRYIRQNGGPGAYGDVTLAIRPQTASELASGDDVRFELGIKGGVIDRSFHASIEEGVRAELARGGQSGVRIVGVHVTLIDGSMHAQDSNERAFAAAGALAIREALGSLGVELLEPWMRVEVDCPTEFVGGVIGSIHSVHGRVSEVVANGGISTVRATAALSGLFGYAGRLRSLTQGRGSCVVEPAGFQPVLKRSVRGQ